MESTNRPYVVCHMLMTLDGKRESASLFEKPAFLPERLPAVFHLKTIEKLDDDALWLRYTKV